MAFNGQILTYQELKRQTTHDDLRGMDEEQLTNLWIRPTERLLQQAFSLELDTDSPDWISQDPRGVPHRLRWMFDNATYAGYEQRFLDDFKTAALISIEFLAANPYDLLSEGNQAASATFAKALPERAKILLQKWSRLAGGRGSTRTGRLVRGS